MVLYILILVDNSLADNFLIFNVGSYHVGVDMSIKESSIAYKSISMLESWLYTILPRLCCILFFSDVDKTSATDLLGRSPTHATVPELLASR